MEIGIDGLTCSLCSRSVEMSLRKLDFVQTVYMDLEKTQGRIYFKPELDPQPDKIAQAVKNAGYSVRFLTAVFRLTAGSSKGKCFSIGKNTFQILPFRPDLTWSARHAAKENRSVVQANPVGLDEQAFRFIGKQYLTKTEYTRYRKTILEPTPDSCKGSSVYKITPIDPQ
ncbi:heavy metal-associated domain-containing protein [Xanthocytophaga flavus]|nr:heavy metal-associated domain-containing protein [Xanthocytophaga flavus]